MQMRTCVQFYNLGETMNKDKIKYPVLKAFRVSRESIIAWCPFCNKFHHHGGAPGEDYEGHRVAHCTEENSPFQETGYIIKKHTLAELKEIKSAIEFEINNWELRKGVKINRTPPDQSITHD